MLLITHFSGLTLREILRLAYIFSTQDVYASLFSYRDCQGQLDLLDGMRYSSSHEALQILNLSHQ